MTTKQQYEQVIISVNSVLSAMQGLTVVIDETDLILDDQLTLIDNNLLAIEATAQIKLDAIEQEQVMASFLAEMNVVFDKYSATISTMAFEDGYGVGYGEPGTGFLLTASLDGVTSTKEIKKAVIGSGDLV